ncbi:TrbC/VirB2 family protein [Campylobacter sp. RM12640]|uniref:TrbC/VirB2 family protein n=1 Tax=unclassified Campylobacter TaxID=2593542 RepID=UPI001D50FB4B|nr:TrbC/VirB2 family protein [Campylobacter sp. RM12642]MBZ7982461.1 TrbC/VirB2 family protein [Campylobacter sp. RM12640]MBZ7989966.1 TrbC/VirB2 family protein [Campylobacter sp. RM12635]MBZ8008221.1 TrbC/VirB2 family protein [Campylobacter sp. RM9334]
MKKFLLLFLIFGVDYLLASTGSGMPWEGPLTQLKASLTGPVAFTISILAIMGTGAGLIWGGEISGFMKSLIYVILVAAVVVAANNILAMFGVTGALI